MDVSPSGPTGAVADPSGANAHAPESALSPTVRAAVAPVALAAASLARREELAKIQVFANLRADALDLLAHVVGEESHLRGTVIFRQGDASEKLYLIVEGTVRLTHVPPTDAAPTPGHQPQEVVLATLGPGEVFGELALFDEAPRATNARVEEGTRMLAIHRDAFEDLLFIHKPLAYEILWNMVRLLSRRLRDLEAGASPLIVGARPIDAK